MLDVLRSGQLSLGPRVPAFEAAFAARLGARHASAVSSGTAGLHLALRAVGVEDGDEVVTSPFSFVASANAILYERARPVFVDIDPRTLCLDPDAAAAAITGRTTRAPARPHLRPPGRRRRRSSATACRSSRTPARRSAPCTPTGRRSARAGIRPCSASTPTSSSPPARAAWSPWPPPSTRRSIDSERNQGRAPDMGWLDHDRLGFNYRLTDLACALGLAQLERLDDMLAARARVAGWYRERAGRARRGGRARAARARTPAATCAAGSCSSSRCPRGATATPRCSPCASTACSPSRTCPPST